MNKYIPLSAHIFLKILLYFKVAKYILTWQNILVSFSGTLFSDLLS